MAVWVNLLIEKNIRIYQIPRLIEIYENKEYPSFAIYNTKRDLQLSLQIFVNIDKFRVMGKSIRKEVEKNFGREFTEDEWMDFSIFIQQFLEDILEDLVIKILEEFKSTNS